MRPLPALLALAAACAAALDAAVPVAEPADPDPSGRWVGYLFPPFDALPVGFELERDGVGWGGAFLAPDYGYPSVPLGEVVLEGDSLSVALGHGLGFVRFHGRLDGDVWRGSVHEGGEPTPFAVARAGTEAARTLDAKAAAQRAH